MMNQKLHSMGQIVSERPNLFEPDVYIGLVIQLAGAISCEQLKNAVYYAYGMNEATMSRIVLTPEGDAFYEKMEQTGCHVYIERQPYQEIYGQQIRKAYDLKNGELIRTFIIPEEHTVRVMILAHHLVGDGKAVCMFAQQILSAFSGEELSYHTGKVLTKEELNMQAQLPHFMKQWIGSMNQKWKCTGRVFTWEDYEQLHKRYWEQQERHIDIELYEVSAFDQITQQAKECKVTVNSYMIADLMRDFPLCSVIGIPISIRREEPAMNNMTSGIRIWHRYHQTRSLLWNACRIHQRIQNSLRNSRHRLQALLFVSELSGTLIDSVLMQTHGLYQNPITKKMIRWMGYSGRDKTQVGITNLGIVPLQISDSSIQVEQVLFIPPKVSYSDTVIGIVTVNNRMTVVRC